MSLKRLLTGSLGGTAITNSAILAAGLVTGIITARSLLPDARGAFSSIIFVAAFTGTVLGISLPDKIAARFSRIASSSEQPYVSSMVVLIIIISLGAGLLTLVASVFLVPVFSESFFLEVLYFPIFTAINISTLSLMALFHGSQDFLKYNTARVIVPGVYLSLVCLVALAGQASVANFVLCNLIGNVFCLAYVVNIVCKKFSPSLSQVDWKIVKEGAGGSIIYHAPSLLFLITAGFDRLVLVSSYPMADVGNYFVSATAVSAAMMFLSTTASTVLYPKLAALEHGESWAVIRAYLLGFMSIAFLVAAVSIMTAHVYIPLIFGDQYSDGIKLAQALSVSTALVALKALLNRIMRAMHVARAIYVTEIAMLALLVVAYFVWLRDGSNVMQVVWSIGVINGVASAAIILYLMRLINRRSA